MYREKNFVPIKRGLKGGGGRKETNAKCGKKEKERENKLMNFLFIDRQYKQKFRKSIHHIADRN